MGSCGFDGPTGESALGSKKEDYVGQESVPGLE